MSAVGAAIARAIEGRDLDAAIMEAAMESILAGEATEAQIAGLAIALRMKGETAEEIAAAARVMRRRCEAVEVARAGEVVLDTCGTGGDGAGTFNVSTIGAIVVASCGVRVAKHGNRAVSSRAGSADVLEALGVRIDLSPDAVARCVRELDIGFLFAPAHHGALKHAAPVRRSLGVRTFFNMLGPLANPAGATHQLVGIYDPARLAQVAEVLGLLGSARAWVVHGAGGLDEVSPAGPTEVAELDAGRVSKRTVHPEDFGLEPVAVEALVGGDAEDNARIAIAILEGERGPRRDAVSLNAAAALLVAGLERDPRDAMARASDAIDSGLAREKLEAWIEFTRSTSAE